jgi:hypothetical protein
MFDSNKECLNLGKLVPSMLENSIDWALVDRFMADVIVTNENAKHK